jgi:hypothetical protein
MMRVCIRISCIILLFAKLASAHSPNKALPGSADLRAALSGPVEVYENNGKPLIPTLLDVSLRFRLPMGIERVVPEALRRPIDVKARNTTVAGLLDLCVQSLPDYAWTVNNAAVHVYGPAEWKRADNLFNRTIPGFAVREATVNEVNWLLRDRLRPSIEATGQAIARAPVGVGGDSPGIGGMERKLSFTMPRNATLRDILNRTVSLYGGLAWVARVVPERLSVVPGGGLWQLLPLSPSASIEKILETPSH